MRWDVRVLLGSFLLAYTLAAADMAIQAEPYATGGLFTNPLIGSVGDAVRIGVRVEVDEEMARPVTCRLTIEGQGVADTVMSVDLQTAGGAMEGSAQWTPDTTGVYTLRAEIDPDGDIAEIDETNNRAALRFPVVIPGRRPHFPWFGHRAHLRWATIWAGGFKKEDVPRWRERGVEPLRWKWGNNIRKPMDEEAYYTMYSDFDGTTGIAVDECGFYPDTLVVDPAERDAKVQSFVDCLRGMARAKQEHQDAFFLAWHSGSLYPEQAAMYRKACDLLVVESYVTYYMPKSLSTENVYAVLDAKMHPARQVDMLNATGKGPQVITSIDLRPQNFHRGEIEQIVRHLRRTWPEMRGFGIFGGLLANDMTAEQRQRAEADEQFVDQLYYRYFVPAVVTFLPGSVWFAQQEDTLLIQAAVSNIGGMHSGPLTVSLLVDDDTVATQTVETVPAGDSLLENRRVVSAEWTPTPGHHRVTARIDAATGSTVLDATGENTFFIADRLDDRQ